MTRSLVLAALFAVVSHHALAQDVPGIEICTAEKTMERRTSCLQSNVNFLKATLTKAALDNQQKLDAATRQIDALKATVIGLQKTVEQLQGQMQALDKKPAGAATPAASSPAVTPPATTPAKEPAAK